MPEMHLISVLLPAPLSPTMAVSSPRSAHTEAPRNATTSPNDFQTSLTSTRCRDSVRARRGAPVWGEQRPRGVSLSSCRPHQQCGRDHDDSTTSGW